MTDLEIIVVVDGADPETEAVVAAIAHPRLQVVVLPDATGAPTARTTGISLAHGTYVALLDDDDLWLPTKLERQLEALRASDVEEPIAFCARLVRSTDGLDTAWADRPPAPGEHPSDYLFVRRSLRLGESTVSTSTILALRSLFERVPFDASARRYEDVDWVLRACAAGARLIYVPERLAVWRAPVGDASITGRYSTDWRYGIEWIRERRHLVTPQAYAAFLLVRVAAMADRAGEPGAARIIWREARRNGRPRAMDVGLFVARWIIPDRLRAAQRSRLAQSETDASTAAAQG
jgi:glycosyltransferase involved in cell wall biosynthesis